MSDDKTPRQPTAREVERALGAELLDAMLYAARTTTQAMERLSGQTINNTLLVWSGVIDSSGVASWDFNVAAGCVKVTNLAATTATKVVVSSASTGPNTPTGLGTAVIPGGTADVVPLASRVLSIYGPAGTQICVQVFTSAVHPVTTAPGPAAIA